MFKLFFALIQHTIAVLTFRHDGTGLPSKKHGALLIIAALAILVSVLHGTLLGASLGVAALISGVSVGFIIFLIRPAPSAVLLLAGIGIELLQCLVIVLADPANPPAYLGLAGLVWKMAAFAFVLRNMLRAKKQIDKEIETK